MNEDTSRRVRWRAPVIQVTGRLRLADRLSSGALSCSGLCRSGVRAKFGIDMVLLGESGTTSASTWRRGAVTINHTSDGWMSHWEEGYGAHKRAHQVLDVDRYYLKKTQILRCNSVGCKTNYISTSKATLDQLDLAHRQQFRLILTVKYACDIWVIRFLRERTLVNSTTHLVRQLRENHSEEAVTFRAGWTTSKPT